MKLYKKFLVLFLLIVLCLSFNATYAASTAANLPTIYQDSLDIEEDPLYAKYMIAPMSRVALEGETLEHLISEFEDGTAAVGIDVSKWQKNIDWKAVSEAGVKFAMIRCGYRGTGSGKIYEDETFKANIQGALDNDIYVGIYFYSAAINEEEALEEAKVTVSLIKDYDIKYPVAYDFENFKADGSRTDNLSKEQLNKNAESFLSYIKEQGYIASLYGSSNPLKNTWDESVRSNYDVWVAHYGADKPSYTGNYSIWQCTSKAQVPGISGNVDIDIDYRYYMDYHITDISDYMFDATYYADRNRDLKNAFGYDEDALKAHFEKYGKKEGRCATPLFDAKYYLNRYPDLQKNIGTNYEALYNHFMAHGIHEGRVASPYFNVNYYIKNNYDVRKTYYSSKTWAFTHFAKTGLVEGRLGSDEFDIKTYYNNQSKYVKNHLGSDYKKYYALADGGTPINDPTVDISRFMFDSKYYADKYFDLKTAFGYDEDALRAHFEKYGKKEGRCATPLFDAKYYLNKYPDLQRNIGTNYEVLYNHFVKYGIHEGRIASPDFNVKAYVNNYNDLQTIFGTNYSKAAQHYMLYGRNENRKAI